MSDFRAEYLKYIVSYEWRKKAQKLKKEIKFCDRCGRFLQIGIGQVHHKHYQTLGKETREDLEVLCKNCHRIADIERAQEGARRSEAAYADALYEARLDGWATKVYGEEWHQWLDPERVEEEFDAWLDNKGDDF